MDYRQFLPSYPLTAFIECYWIFRAPEAYSSTNERLIPGGRIECMFNFSSPLHLMIGAAASIEPSRSEPVLMGQRDRVFYARVTGETRILGIRFKPGGLYAFTDYSTESLLNEVVPAAAVFGSAISTLDKKLKLPADDEDRMSWIDKFLVQKLRKPVADFESALVTIDNFKRNKDAGSITEFCESSDIHYKKLERSMQKYAGYTPKSYFRLLRFNRALRKVIQPDQSLTAVAHGCGYYDQSHFIRDFKHFTGIRPGLFDVTRNPMSRVLLESEP